MEVKQSFRAIWKLTCVIGTDWENSSVSKAVPQICASSADVSLNPSGGIRS